MQKMKGLELILLEQQKKSHYSTVTWLIDLLDTINILDNCENFM